MSFAWEDWEYLDRYDKTKLEPLEGKPDSGYYSTTEYIMKRNVDGKDTYTLVGVADTDRKQNSNLYHIVTPIIVGKSLNGLNKATWFKEGEFTLYKKPADLNHESRGGRQAAPAGGKKSRKHIKSRKNKKSRKLRKKQ